jgi:hypothetical protein
MLLVTEFNKDQNRCKGCVSTLKRLNRLAIHQKEKVFVDDLQVPLSNTYMSLLNV